MKRGQTSQDSSVRQAILCSTKPAGTPQPAGGPVLQHDGQTQIELNRTFEGGDDGGAGDGRLPNLL